MNLRKFSLLAAAAFSALTSASHAGVLVLNLSQTAGAGTPIAGAAWNGSTIVSNYFGTDYKDFAFNLTSSPPFSLSDLAVVANADAQNKAGGSTLGITIWAGPLDPAPIFSNALGTITVAATNWPGAGYQDITFGPGGLSPVSTITNLPDNFFIRVWGTGEKNVSGFKVKLGSAFEISYATNTSPGLVMSNLDGTNSSNAPTFNYTGPTPTPTPTPGPVVPEPGTWAMGALLLGTAGYIRWRRRASVA